MNCASASTRSRLRTGYSTKSSRLVALVMRMERISLSLSLILSLLPSSSLSLSHSAERSLPSAASPANHQNSIPKVYQRNWQLGTQKTESTTPGKKITFLPSRDHQNLDLDAMCLDLESSRLPNQEIPGRGNVASIHQHPPTHLPTSRETETQRKNRNRQQDRASQLPPPLPSTAPTHHHFSSPNSTPATALPLSAEHHHERSPTPLPHPSSSLPSLQPPNLATSQKTKISGQNRKGWRICSRIGFLRRRHTK